MRRTFVVILALWAVSLASYAQNSPLNVQAKRRIDAFAKTWLEQRNTSATLAFFDDSAYRQPAVFGAVCDGWYRLNMPEKQIRQIIASNLIDTVNDFPAGTAARRVLNPALLEDTDWKRYALNWVDSDGYLLVELGDATINGMFFPRLQPIGDRYVPLFNQLKKDNGELYWAVMPMTLPDGDLFIVFTAWQHVRDNWYITHSDIMCQ